MQYLDVHFTKLRPQVHQLQPSYSVAQRYCVTRRRAVAVPRDALGVARSPIAVRRTALPRPMLVPRYRSSMHAVATGARSKLNWR